MGLIKKLAVTVQAPVIGPVVYVDPERLPPHPETDAIEYPVFGVSVKAVVLPWLTIWAVDGLIVPFPPGTVGVTA
jgi:hypothetical protein